MSKFGALLMLMCFSVGQVLSLSIPIYDESEWPLPDIDEEIIDIPVRITAETPTACKGEFSLVGDHCYYFSHTKATWQEASKACQVSLNAALAHPKNSEENSQLTQYIRDNKDTAAGWWIGATDRDDEGQWVWAHDNTPVAYTNWLYGEPNDGYENEDCVHLRRDVNYKWNDVTCENKYHYICQYVDQNEEFSSGEGRLEEVIPSTTTTAAPLTVSKSDFVQLGEHSYYFSRTKATFDQAYKACQSIDTQLAHPRNSVENSKITGHIRESETIPIAWWIGATDRDDEGRWVWAHDNTSVIYDNWLRGEPNNEFDNEHCAHLRKDVNYKWNDAPCNNKYNFICQSENLNVDSQESSSTETNLEGVLHTNYCKRTTSVATVNSQKSDFTRVGDNCYHFSHTKASFKDASKACQSIGAEFAHPMSYQENLQLTDYLRNKYQDDYKGWWIGATDEDKEGQWYWAHDKSPVGYADWSSGEPNDAYENEHCAHYRRNTDYKWNDVPCGNKYNYICQYGNVNDSSLELPSGEEDTSDEENSSEVVTSSSEVVTSSSEVVTSSSEVVASSGEVMTGGEVEAEIDENTEEMLVSAATWNLNGCYSTIVITCAVISANLLITQHHTAS